MSLARARQGPFSAWLHDGTRTQDGVADWIEPSEFSGLEGKPGSPYAGIPVMRPTAATISGATPPADFTGVIFLTGQATPSYDGAHELFHTLESVGWEQADVESGGELFETYGISDLDIGLYTTETVTWNWGWIDPTDSRIVDGVIPMGYEVLQAGSIFSVGGGDNQGLWVTVFDGIHTGAKPLAEYTSYVPGDEADWDVVPITAAEALDMLAALPRPTYVVNTDGDPGTTIYVGTTDPEDMIPAPTLEVGDLWIDTTP
jgi:hypothetical protein